MDTYYGRARRRLKNELENADFSDVQSETLSHITANLATRADLQLLGSEMKELSASLRGEMAEFRGEMRGEMGSMSSRLETQITKASSKTQRLMMGLIIALGAIFTATNIISYFAQ